ncbi:hypothetical protein GF361_00665 [Candidatus Woesearchaeota archaeon]|nr:hypothetical protein [Candidatus Woesearchaeota archaeon]
MSIKDKKRKAESKIVFLLWILFIFSSVFVIEYTKDYKTGITGFVVLNCTGDICDEGDVIAEGQEFTLNYDSVCEKVLKFEFADGEGVWITDTSGTAAGNSPVEVNESECDENGCSLVFTYNIYPEEPVDYEMRFESVNKTLYLEDTSKDCPVYCGDSVCEGSEDYASCEEDCLHKEGDYLALNTDEKERYFATNYDEECERLFLFLDFDGTNIKIKEIENDRFYNIQYKNRAMILNHTGMIYELLYDQDNDTLFLKDTDTGCSYDCEEENIKECYNQTAVQKCQRDEYGYLRWEITQTCSGFSNNCVRGMCLSCEDECSKLGKRSCYNDTAYQVCGNFYDIDFDSCYEWGNITDCEEWYECDDGDCVLECEDECDEENETGCFNNSVGECKDIDDDPCLEWELIEGCDSDIETCIDGECKCLENWVCGNWSSCINGQQTRTCTDENSCGTTEDKLLTLRQCECEPNYVCGNWGKCQQNNKQTRTCRDMGCGEEDSTETRPCTYVPEVITSSDEIYRQGEERETGDKFVADEEGEGGNALFWIMIFLSIIILGGGIWFAFYEIKKSKSNLENEKKRKRPSSESLIQLRNYTKKCMDEGFTKEQIKKRLLEEGWSKEMVGRVFKVI